MCCVTLSELFLGETIGLSAKNNLPFQSILFLLHAFQKNFKLYLVSRERNDREPNGEVYEVWVYVTFSAFFLG